MAGRTSVLQGEIIELTAWFKDGVGNFVDPDAGTLTLSIYPPGKDPRLGYTTTDAWVYDVTLSSGGSGPEANPVKMIERVDLGKYKFSFLVPSDADLGASFDRWEAEINTYDLDEVFSFVIVGGGSVGTTKLYTNNTVYVSFDSAIASTDGSTLGEDLIQYFTTTYEPLYTYVKRIRLELGPLISDVPDDTINLAIFEAGLEADQITFNVATSNTSYFKYIRSQYVICRAQQILLKALSGDNSLFGSMRKQLADLSVARTAGPQMMKNLEDLAKCIEDAARIIHAGGEKSPYTSLRPGSTVKGANSEDAMHTARQWYPTSSVGDIPAGNTTTGRSYTSRKGFKSYRSRTSGLYGPVNRDED